MGKLSNPDLMIDMLNMDLIKCKIQNISKKKKKKVSWKNRVQQVGAMVNGKRYHSGLAIASVSLPVISNVWLDLSGPNSINLTVYNKGKNCILHYYINRQVIINNKTAGWILLKCHSIFSFSMLPILILFLK